MIEQKCAIVFIVFYEAFSLLLDGLVDGGECSNVVQLRDARSAGTTWRQWRLASISTGSTDPGKSTTKNQVIL